MCKQGCVIGVAVVEVADYTVTSAEIITSDYHPAGVEGGAQGVLTIEFSGGKRGATCSRRDWSCLSKSRRVCVTVERTW